MDIASLNQLLTSRLNTLNDAKIRAISVGDIEQVNAIDKDMMETKNTLQQLLLITNVAAAAASANTTPADVVNSGIAAVTNTDDQTPTPTVQGPSASAYINGYDISAYATDPLYEQKVQTIIKAMPPLSNASDITTYIQGIAPGSPVTGDMVLSSAIQYSVDVPLLIAIMQNDSQFGTVGVGARTNNPGNVGNTGSAERTYNSWAEGVAAVAEWLNRHRIVPLNTTVDTPTIVPVTETPIVTPVTTPDTTTSNQSTTPTTDTTTPDQSTTTPTTDTTTPTTTDTTTPTTDNSPVIQSDIPATDTGTDTTSGTNKTVGVSKQKRKNIA